MTSADKVFKRLLCVSCHGGDPNLTTYEGKTLTSLDKSHRIHLRWTKRMDSYHEITESLLDSLEPSSDCMEPKSDDGTMETRITTDHDHRMDQIKIENMR